MYKKKRSITPQERPKHPFVCERDQVKALMAGTLRKVIVKMEQTPSVFDPGSNVWQTARNTAYFDAYCSSRKTQDNPRGMGDYWCWWTPDNRQGTDWIRCPFGRPGDILYFQEALIRNDLDSWTYEVDGAPVLVPSSHKDAMATWMKRHKTPHCKAPKMPEFAARNFALLTQVEAIFDDDQKIWNWHITFD